MIIFLWIMAAFLWIVMGLFNAAVEIASNKKCFSYMSTSWAVIFLCFLFSPAAFVSLIALREYENGLSLRPFTAETRWKIYQNEYPMLCYKLWDGDDYCTKEKFLKKYPQ